MGEVCPWRTRGERGGEGLVKLRGMDSKCILWVPSWGGEEGEEEEGGEGKREMDGDEEVEREGEGESGLRVPSWREGDCGL